MQWPFEGLVKAGLPTICIETRHIKAFLKAQPHKSDRNDARGIAQMMRVNLFRPVHVKTLTSQKRRALLAARRKLREEFSRLHRKVLEIARDDTVCTRLMTVPGVGPVAALAFTSTIDVPHAFETQEQ